MLGMLISPNIPGAPNTWKVWLDYMIKDKGDGLGIKKGALLYLNGAPAASSSGFSLSSSEVLVSVFILCFTVGVSIGFKIRVQMHIEYA